MKKLGKLCLVGVIVASALSMALPGKAASICCTSCGFRLQGCIKQCGFNQSCQSNCQNQYQSCVNSCALQQQFC